MMGSGLGFGILGLGMVIFWGVIVFLVIWLVRSVFGESRNRVRKSAIEILDERFAHGEIGREEYDEKKALT
jgi:putative membrane protein